MAGERLPFTPYRPVPHAPLPSHLTTPWCACARGRYATTIHVINSCIVKLGHLMKAHKVYRGISGARLPREFTTRSEKSGVRGGIEFGFSSTTLDKEVALTYAGKRGLGGIVYEIQMGMIDRGADISWLSQYPHEKEILFAPLSGLEITHHRLEQAVLVVSVRPSVNLNALTIEEVVAKMQRSQLQLLSTMIDDLKFGGAPITALAPLEALHR